MENPNTWGKVRKVISDTIAQHDKNMKAGVCGYSLETMIYNALHNRGWLVEDSKDLEETFKVTQE